MKKYVLFTIFSAILFCNNTLSQSAHYFKTSRTLEYEKKDAQQSGNTALVNEITKELDARTKAYSKIDLLQADIDNKLQAEDYFGAQSLKDEMEKLKIKLAKEDDIRQKIETSLAVEDYQKAEQHKNELKALNNPAAAVATTPVQQSTTTTTTSGFSGTNNNSGFTQGNNNSGFSQSNNSGFTQGNVNVQGLASFIPGAGGITNAASPKQAQYDKLMKKSRRKKTGGVLGYIFGISFIGAGTGLLIAGLEDTGGYTDYYSGDYYSTGPNETLVALGSAYLGLGTIITFASPFKIRKSKRLREEANSIFNSSSISPIITPMYNNASQTWGINAGVGIKCNF